MCDTGPLVAAADRDDADNRACTDLLTSLHLAGRAILVPAPVVAEVGYLLGRASGAAVEAAFLRSIAERSLTIVDLQIDDYTRMAELVETYADFPLGTTDAAVVAVSERLGITRGGHARPASLPRRAPATHLRPHPAPVVGLAVAIRH